jgi:D-alanyl-D-alanine carboxypeptidase
VVTKSANDAAVTIAENLGGGEEEQFAKLMTQKAHALGMSRTTYVNASGLPDDAQVTTARDQALLGRAIQERFPRYYKYFSTEEFVYHGSAMRNHNHLLGVVGGVDGIKTGYTRASGFNLVTSVHRDGRYIVAVVLGGRSAGERDAHMRELIGAHIREASLQRTAPAAEKFASRGEFAARNELASRSEVEVSTAAKVQQRSRAEATVSNAAAEARASLGTSEPIHPVLVRTITYRTAPPQTAPLAPMPVLVPTSASRLARRGFCGQPQDFCDRTGPGLDRCGFDRAVCRGNSGENRAVQSRAGQRRTAGGSALNFPACTRRLAYPSRRL